MSDGERLTNLEEFVKLMMQWTLRAEERMDELRAAQADAEANIQRIIDGGFRLRGMKLIHMTRAEAEGFYAVHRERPFFGELTTFMSSGPAVLLALDAPDAIKKWRDLMGATDPAKAEAGTLRKDFGESIG